ncbi:MAG: sulfatase-like hydrolase/transferase [Spirosomataceae bacterium]
MKPITFLFFFFFTNTLFAQTNRPNILWLTYEDTSPEFLGCYGNAKAKTPFMDSLAAVGVKFTAAFSTGSVCSPSRTALITGMKTYTTGTGHHRSKYPIPAFIKGFPYYLRQAGYYTSNNVKTDYNVAKEGEFIKTAWDESSAKAGWWNRAAGQPFFAVFNNNSSHQSRTMTNSYSEYENMVLKNLPKPSQIAENEVIMPPFYRDSPEMRRNVARIYNSISLADREMKQLFERLKKDNLLDETILFVFADHGEGMPRAKTNGIGLGHRVPFIIWFPEKFKHLSPWKKAGAITDDMIDFTDLAPTVLALAGVDIPTHFSGRNITDRMKLPKQLFLSSDRSDESTDLTRTIIEGKYAYTRVFKPFMQELRFLNYMDKGDITAQIRRDFKDNKLDKVQQQMLLPRPVEFLYDLEKDPWEIHNLALEPSYQNQLVKWRNDLKKHLIEQRDVLFLQENEMIEISKKETLYEFRKSDLKYPIGAILEVAFLSGLKTKEASTMQCKALQHPNSSVRYWAAMGLRSQSAQNIKSNRVALVKAIQSDDPIVQVIAALAWYRASPNKFSFDKLMEIMLSDNEEASFLAFQLVMYQENAADFEQAARQFLTTNKTQNIKPKVLADMLLYMLGKEKFVPVSE